MQDSTVVRQQFEEEYTLEKTEEQKEFDRQERMQLFGAGLRFKFDIQVGLKEEIEQRWLDDLRHYNGRYDRETEANLSKKTDKSKSSRIVVNLTRAKTNIAESKLSDLVLPTDDRNWGIKPTPVPELAGDIDNKEDAVLADGSLAVDVENDNKPFTKGDIAKEVMAEAKKRAEAMQDEIDDQLSESDFNTRCREIIHDACLLGIGILKGPMIKKSKNRAWIEDENGQWKLDYSEEIKPTVDRVDPWNFFPDMSAVQQGDWEFTYERHLKTKKQMRELASQPGYMQEQIKRVLQMAPNARGAKLTYLNELREMNGISQIQHDNRYELLEYRGPISKNDLIACNYDVDLENPLEEYEGVVWFVDGIVIKVGLNHMDDDSAMYSVLNWESDEVSVFGFGVPFRMRNPQKVMNASWRMVLDNAGLSTGPQILINRELIEPADGVWTLSPRKVWWMKTKDPKFRADYAMQTFNIDSKQTELTNIFQIAKQLADEETSLPQMNMGGIAGSEQQQPAAMKTLGGTQLWMTSNSIPMRRAVKNWDDYIIRPFITRVYDWNMQFNKKAEIKGDYQIDARGTSVLLVKEIQSRNIVDFVNTAMALPGGPEELDTRGVLEEHAKALQVSGMNMLKEKGAAEAGKENQPPDPEMIKLQLQQDIAQEESARKIAEMESNERIAKMNNEVEMTKLAVSAEGKLTEIRSKAGIEKYREDMSMMKFYEEIKQKQKAGITANFGLD